MPVVLNKASHSLIEQGLAILGNAGVTDLHWQENVINNRITCAQVTTVMRGEPFSGSLSSDQRIELECTFTRQYCEMARITYPGDEVIAEVLGRVPNEIEQPLRFIPAGVGLREAMQFFYSFNDRMAANLRLQHERYKEWWRSNTMLKAEITGNGVICCDFGRVMQATDLAARPFYLNETEQVEWAKEQGGDGLTSAAETLILFGRSLQERALPLWGGGTIRTRDVYDSGVSLCVHWDARVGLSLNFVGRGERDWFLGALPWK